MALIWASNKNDVGIVELLTQSNVHPNIQDKVWYSDLIVVELYSP
jgi:hypothetical protein